MIKLHLLSRAFNNRFLQLSMLPMLTGAVFSTTVSEAMAQTGMTFSIDFQGPTNGLPDSFYGIPIDEGSILTPFPPGPPGPNDPAPGPLPSPGMVVCSMAPCAIPSPFTRDLELIPTSLGYKEVDALSYGRDMGDLYFSVDEFAIGIPSPMPPNVLTEGAAGNEEASADVFRYLGPNEETPFPPTIFGNKAVVDGNGIAPFGGPGVGLIEPNPPTVGSYDGGAGSAPDPRDPGDNLDALDLDTTRADLDFGNIYFSLDSAFSDPLETAPLPFEVPPNTGSAVANGFVGGDVIVNLPGGGNVLYASAATLGLDLFGEDTDDLDALVLKDLGIYGVFEPGIDLIEFSVRRNSSVIGTPDSRLGILIEEGDVLTLPTSPGLAPSILIPAEALGLATVRSGTAASYGVINPTYNEDVWADDVDALDKVAVPEPGTILGLLAVSSLGLTLKRNKQS